MPKKCRLWCFTQFDLDFDFHELFDKKQIRFLAWGKEVCPSTGRQHLQGFVYFHNQQGSMKNLNKMFGGAHLEQCKGTLAENEAYCSKEENYETLGEKPPGRGCRTDIDAEVERVRKGEITCDELCLENPSFMHQYGRVMDRIEDITLRGRWRNSMTTGIWYTGPTSAGKSHMCFVDYDPSTHYEKTLADKWWDGYKGQETVILNEFRGEINFGELMALVDKWPMKVPRRGREPVPFLAKVVKVSTIMSPADMWPGQPLEEFNRRFQVVNLKKRNFGPEVL